MIKKKKNVFFLHRNVILNFKIHISLIFIQECFIENAI